MLIKCYLAEAKEWITKETESLTAVFGIQIDSALVPTSLASVAVL